MKGYKATYNMKCLDHLFEVGETYETPDLEMCKSGFHFCPVMNDVLRYYDLKQAFILLEVEALGNIQTLDNKCATDKIKILRVVPKEEYVGFPEVEFDENGNIIHSKYSSETEYWKEYDESGNLLHYKNSDGFECWSEYDKNGKLIHYKSSNGSEYWNEYDETEREIHYKNSDGYEYWNEYDENGKLIHYKNSNGYEWWKKYDEKDNVIHCKNSDGIEWNRME